MIQVQMEQFTFAVPVLNVLWDMVAGHAFNRSVAVCTNSSLFANMFMRKYRFRIFVITMELHYNHKNL